MNEMNIQSNKGFTLIELLLSLAVFSIVILGVGEIYVLFQRYWLDSARDTTCQSTGRTVLDKITRDIRMAQDVVVINNTNTSEIQIRDLDDVVSSYEFDQTTRQIIYDEDISSGGSGVLILQNVNQIDSTDVFRSSGDKMIAIRFRVQDPLTQDGYQGADFVVDAYWRN